MPYKILVFAQDVGNRLKGYISDIRDPATPWGNKETLPNFIRVEVTDGKTWQEAKDWQGAWHIQYVFSVLDDKPTHRDYRVEVDPIYISASDKGKDEIKQELVDFIESESQYEESVWYGSSVIGFAPPSSIDIRIPKPHDAAVLKEEFNQRMVTTLEIDRYYFKESGVDWAIGQGGSVAITQAQALNNIIDKLTE